MKISLLLIINLFSIAMLAQQGVTLKFDSSKNNKLKSEQYGKDQKINATFSHSDSNTVDSKQISDDSLARKQPSPGENGGWLTHTNTIVGLVVAILTTIVLLFTIRGYWKKRKEK